MVAMGPKQARVLGHVAAATTTTIDDAAGVTGLTYNEARAMLKTLARQGLVFERLGYDGDRPLPRGRYVITEDGLRRMGRWEEWRRAVVVAGP
jgi:DNA-binding IclR family transcriptional regulator